jgi:hypothetical protein
MVDVLPDSSFLIDETLAQVAPGLRRRIKPEYYLGYRMCMSWQIARDVAVIEAYRIRGRAVKKAIRAFGDWHTAGECVDAMKRRISTESATMTIGTTIQLISDHDRTVEDVRAYADELELWNARREKCDLAADQARAAADEAWDTSEKAFAIWLEAISDALSRMEMKVPGSKRTVDWEMWAHIHTNYFDMRRLNRDVAMATVLANLALDQLQLARRSMTEGMTPYVRAWAACWDAQESAKAKYTRYCSYWPVGYQQDDVPPRYIPLWNLTRTRTDIQHFGEAEARGIQGAAPLPADYAPAEESEEEEEEVEEDDD